MRGFLLRHPGLDVVGPLTRPELDHSNVGQSSSTEWIFLDDGLYLIPALADRDDDSTVARDFASRHEKMSRRVVLLQEPHVRGHVLVDFGQGNLIYELDHKHRALSIAQRALPVKREARR